MLPISSTSTTFAGSPVGGEPAKQVFNIAELVLMILAHLNVRELGQAARVCRYWKDLAKYQEQYKIYRVVRSSNQLAKELFHIYRNLDLGVMNAIVCASESNKHSHILIFIGNSSQLPLRLRAPGAGANDPMAVFQMSERKYALLAKSQADFQQDASLQTLVCRTRGTQEAKIELIFLNAIHPNEPCFDIDEILQAIRA